MVTCSGTIGRVGIASSYMDGWAASQHILRIIPNIERGHPGYIAAFLMTPYGKHQISSKIYGAVVDELTAEDTSEIWIPDAPIETQETIGDLVLQAFELKGEANSLEEETITKLEQYLETLTTSE